MGTKSPEEDATLFSGVAHDLYPEDRASKDWYLPTRIHDVADDVHSGSNASDFFPEVTG
jgi:hypothetical protein